MKSKPFFLWLFLILAMLIAAIILYPYLPDQIPTHWNVYGQADGWGNKGWAAWLVPGICTLLLLLFPLLAKIDPKKENYEQFTRPYEVIQTLLISFFAFVFTLQYVFTFYPEKQALMTPLMFSGVGVMFILMGNYMGKVRQNFFVGLKTPWTLADPEVWQKSQRLAGWMFVLGGIIFLIEAWLQKYILAAFILVIATIVIVPTVYSYWLFRTKKLK